MLGNLSRCANMHTRSDRWKKHIEMCTYATRATAGAQGRQIPSAHTVWRECERLL